MLKQRSQKYILFILILITAGIFIAPTNCKELEVNIIIETYGDAWEGYLAFGLFEYNESEAYDWVHGYLLIMNTSGHIEYLKDYPTRSYNEVEFISPNTLMYQEPRSNTNFLDLATKEPTNLNEDISGHHDIEYNPLSNTFLTLQKDVREINGTSYEFDKIVEIDINGTILWEWTCADYFNISQQCPWSPFRRGSLDFTHCNSLDWKIEENIVYLNIRNLNTFCKINKTSGELLWSCGEYGNYADPDSYDGDFDLIASNGSIVPSLWYHSHAVKEVEPNVFIMFDNDLHNKSDTLNHISRILEVTVNETSKTAWISWNWTAPREYYCPQWGDADRLPNGNRFGTFGAQQHETENSTGAILVEVNDSSEVVREYTFPYAWGIYRVEQIGYDEYPIGPRISDFETYFENLNVEMIYPSTIGGKPLGCEAASTSDWLASAYIYSKLGHVSEGLDTDELFVNQSSGSPQADSGVGVITFGGPLVNPIVKYAESDDAYGGILAPIRYEKIGDKNWFFDSNNYPVVGLPSNQLEERDFFVIEVMQDTRGRNLMVCYGFGWKGTLAAGKYFESVVYDNLSEFNCSWIIVKWEDTNGNGFVNTPEDGDAYIIMARDPYVASDY
jgi:hypothetical protein